MKARKYSAEYKALVSDILEHPKFQALREIEHHGNGLYAHSVSVGYYSYRIAKRLGLVYVSVARGALLHDFFFEDWRVRKKTGKGLERIRQMHGFTHPKEALANARQYFEINDKEADMIVKHMFPLTITPPKHCESWVVTMVDKGVAVGEMVSEHTPRKIYHRYRLQNS
ncbi:MAG: phosphohydrolase [Eubacterium sp.]|nr:phosphohydrolase [Eubacterium sp.]